ncbi:unnamed protein product [Cladocopium goreaui]|uniref:Zinc finger CCHC domain-containing protein 13 n=1 Tax=Cladocopium goreaui TaxID=2562237 RepID=A0A9P1BHU9_9DINO|nr:unnamed protein product [Cladocopium goreaui]
MGYGKTWGASYGKADRSWEKHKSEPYEPEYKRTCSNCGGRGHDASQCSSKVMCPICGIPGHSKEICWNITKRCSICGKRGHLQNVCTSKGPVKTTKTEKWWKKDDTDTSKGCTRCGGDKWHMKRLCPAFGHRCELCSHENHYEFMCGAKAKKAKEAKEAKAKEEKQEWNKSNWKSDWKSTKSKFQGKTWKMTMRPTASKITKGRTTTKGKGTKRKKIECDCCGSWSHEKMDCPFAKQRCDKCGMKGHLKQKCQQDQQDPQEQPAPQEQPEPQDAQGDDDLEPEDAEEYEDVEDLHEDMGSEPFEEGPEHCSCCGNPDHDTELCPLIDMTCELCGMQGHMENMCDTQEVPSTEKPGLSKGSQQPKSPEMKPQSQPQAQEAAPVQGMDCYCCGESGHLKQHCPLRGHVCSLCGREGHLEAKCRNKEMECYCCGEFGHQKVDCPFNQIPCTYCGKVGHLRSKCRDAPKVKPPWHKYK